jgi:beta-N-acetylhexosaminidase
MPLGPLMIGIQGTQLSAEEREMARHPSVGGVILFARNYDSPPQLLDLSAAIRGLRRPRLLLAVDQEGGRVQRFREGLTRLPAPGTLGRIYDRDHAAGLRLARSAGWLMAAELRAHGVDFSFAPVADVDNGCLAIGDRAFHRDPEVVADLAAAYMRGMQMAGMQAVAKHFPGHGSVAGDSHLELPVDRRGLADVACHDLVPFARLIHEGVAAVMVAHLVFPAIDERPAGFSERWIRGILRRELGFAGLVFSDDLGMEGAAGVGGPLARVQAALQAGCDMALLCNSREAVLESLAGLTVPHDPVAQLRLLRMHGRGHPGPRHLRASARWQRTVRRIQKHCGDGDGGA